MQTKFFFVTVCMLMMTVILWVANEIFVYLIKKSGGKPPKGKKQIEIMFSERCVRIFQATQHNFVFIQFNR